LTDEQWDSSSCTVGLVREVFPMFPLAVRGLEDAIKGLLKQEPIRR